MMPEEGADYYDRLQGESNKLQDIEGRLRVAKNRRSELQRQIEGEEPVFGLVPSDDAASMSVAPQDRQIAQFEQQLAELRLKYTDTHPDIVAIKKTIEDLRAEKEAAASKGAPSRRAYSPLDLNPVYQQMKIQLSQVDVDIAQLQAEYSSQAGVVGGLRQKVNTIPAVEAELKRLMRDYELTKKQYDELLQRVETARMSEDANNSNNDVTYRFMDPPAVTPEPVGPNRPLLMTVVLLFALLAGFALSVALNFLKPVFYTGKDLERRFGVPVLGSIRLVHTEVEMAMLRQRQTLVIASLAGLGVFYALLLLFGGGPIADGGFLKGLSG
jgi:polysaccharide chain length determinant protein (PEP-CTERM system associated)